MPDHPHDNDKRQSARSPVALNGQCRTSAGNRSPVALVDLTPEGCCILTKQWLEVGDWVQLAPEGLSNLRAQVRWRKDQLAGLLFEKPLYEPVHEHLVRSFPRAAEHLAGGPDHINEGIIPYALRHQLLREIARAEAAEATPQSEIEELYQRLPPATPRPGLRARPSDEKVLRLFLG